MKTDAVSEYRGRSKENESGFASLAWIKDKKKKKKLSRSEGETLMAKTVE